MTTRATYLEILNRMRQIDVSDEHKLAFENLVREVAAGRGIHDFGSYDRIQFAKHLLHIESDRAVMRDRICSRYGVSKSQAYSDIEAALLRR